MRKSAVFISFTAIELVCVMVMALHSRLSQRAHAPELLERANLVKTLQLTDLCLFTEARYTRNPAMADCFAPFQDHPTALEHFPSGSFVTPPTMRVHEHSP
ncbi:MAG: hypothetical protein M0T70_02015 [Geobacteraceae bacterium]|nr:hypothetical protein [Geobacteraceae bacterium]